MQSNNQKVYDEFFNMLASNEPLLGDSVFYILERYIEARRQDLGIEKAVHLFLRAEEMVQRGNGTSYRSRLRYNPKTNEPCKKEWNWSTNAFTCDEGVFIDFEITNNLQKPELKGYEKASHLIDFAYTLDHELQHLRQFDKLAKSEFSYENLQMAKDLLALSFMESQPETQHYFYSNTHDELFLERDANNQAKNFLAEQISSRNIGNIVVESQNDKKYDISFILNDREQSTKQKDIDYHYNLEGISTIDGSSYTQQINAKPEKIFSVVTDYLVRSNSNYLKQYPILSLEYNADGSKKTYSEIRQIMQDSLDKTENTINQISSSQVCTIYNKIIAANPLLKMQKMEQELAETYCATVGLREQTLASGIKKIADLIKQENFDVENVLIYFDKRSQELNQMVQEGYSQNYIDDTQKVFDEVKRQLLEEKSDIKIADEKLLFLRDNFDAARKLVEQKCEFSFMCNSKTKPEMLNNLSRLNLVLENDFINGIYSKKGLSKQDITELAMASKTCHDFLNKNGYLFNKDILLDYLKRPSSEGEEKTNQQMPDEANKTIINPINSQLQSKPAPSTDGDPLDFSYTDAEITTMLQEILFEYVYKTDYYQNLDFKIKMQLHAPFNEEIRKKLRRLKKGQELDINAIDYLFEELIKKLNDQKNNSEDLLEEQTRQAELEKLKQVRQQIPTTEEIVEEEQDDGMLM